MGDIKLIRYKLHNNLNFQIYLQILILVSPFQDKFIQFLRSRYAAIILQSELNRVRDEMHQAARKESQQTKMTQTISKEYNSCNFTLYPIHFYISFLDKQRLQLCIVNNILAY